MKNLFNSIQLTKPKKNVFDLTHDVKMSMNMGDLVPCCLMECVPGDKFHLSNEALVRFAPLVSPVMHRFDVTTHYYFVPSRLLWKNWEDFITDKNGGAPHAFPTIDIVAGNYTPLMDYLGIPTPVGINDEVVNAMPLAAYQMVYNEYYRDQNLISEVNFNLVDGDNTGNGDLFLLRKRAWEHDYFTSALPFAQAGAAVNLPVTGDVNLKNTTTNYGKIVEQTGHATPNVGAHGEMYVGVGIGDVEYVDTAGNRKTGVYDPNGTLEIQSASTTINDLRRAYRLQEFLEKAARSGRRYVESILAHFGVRSSDKRLQRPEYITGSKTPVTISEVLNTSDTTNAPQGNMSGHAMSYVKGNYGGYFCEEHGYIIGIVSVMPKTAYQQGMPAHFIKGIDNDRYKFYWPEFANIGEQELKNKEVYAFQGSGGDDPFGYVPRYAEYKFMQNRVAGDFKTSLNFWHEGRIFASPPTLSQQFVECDPSTRIFAVTSGVDHLYVDCLNKVTAIRPMPKFGTPSF